MVKARLSMTARLAFFFASPRLFYLLKCETKIYSHQLPCKNLRLRDADNLLKNRDCEICEISQKFCKTHIFERTIHHPLQYCESNRFQSCWSPEFFHLHKLVNYFIIKIILLTTCTYKHASFLLSCQIKLLVSLSFAGFTLK